MMADKLTKRKNLFDCANPISPLKCAKYVNFETQHLAHLKHHSKAAHTLSKWTEKLYGCESCIFQTYSRYLWLRHKLLNLCTGVRVKSESAISTEKNRDLQIEQRDRNDMKYKCKHCPYVPKKASHLKQHILAKHTDPDKIRWFECAHCSYKSKTKSNLRVHQDHVHEHTNKENMKCDHCPFETRCKQNLKDHILSNHTEHADEINRFKCEQCSYKGKKQTYLNRHMDNKHGNRRIKCDSCPFETKYTQTLKDHVLYKHADPDDLPWFECAQCSYKTKRSMDLKRHTHRVHVESPKVKCEHCQFEAKTKRSLRNHLLRKHLDRKNRQWFQCEHCEYKTPMRDDWRQHGKRVHSKEKI